MKRILPFLLALSACTTLPTPTDPVVTPEQPAPPPVVIDPVPTPAPADKCAMVKEKQPLRHKVKKADGTWEKWDYVQDMPVTKPVAKEAHYLVQGFDPKQVSDQSTGIKDHIARTCALLRGAWGKFYASRLSEGCPELYKGTGSWTPAEGGGIGKGSTGGLFPSVECEAASGNMYWGVGAAPKPGTKYIAKNPANDRAFVLCMGYEAGPGNSARGGGVVREVLFHLKGDHGTVLTLGRAADQSLPYGPIECVQ